MAVDARGNALAVWTARSSTTGHGYIECSARPAGAASWTPSIALSTGDVVLAWGAPALAMSANGAAVIGWAIQDGANLAIVARTLRP